MQHFVHGRVEKEPFAKFGDLHDEWCRQNQETRRSWTAPTLFGRDTIAVSPGGTALGKSKVNPHTEAAFYQNRHVPGPDGAKMRFWVPPLSFARLVAKPAQTHLHVLLWSVVSVCCKDFLICGRTDWKLQDHLGRNRGWQKVWMALFKTLTQHQRWAVRTEASPPGLSAGRDLTLHEKCE